MAVKQKAEWKPCFFCKVTKTPGRIGKIPVCGNCLAEIYEKGKKVSKVEHNP